jgi:CRP-like cAMP-binding protein
MSQAAPIGNKLLATLSQADYDRLLPHLEPVQLSLKQILYEPSQPLQYAYFPRSGIISLLTVLADGQQVVAAHVGNEGMIGVPLLLGTSQIAIQAVVQISGDALRMQAGMFRSEIQPGGALYTLLLRYTQTLLSQISQMVACNRLHPAEERCCYWLAITQDRLDSNELPLTQTALALMLGVRRARVGPIVSTLERAGLIEFQRGKITILDRSGLEAAACECYRIVRTEIDRLFE